MQNETPKPNLAALLKNLPTTLSYLILLGMGTTGAAMITLGTASLILSDRLYLFGTLSLVLGSAIGTLAALRLSQKLEKSKM